MTVEPPVPPKRTDPDQDRDRLDVDPLDIALSAALDGDGGGVAEPHADDARARERRDALAAARDLLAVAPEPLDDVTRARLLRTALDAPPASARRRATRTRDAWLRGGLVAAVVVGVVALAGWAVTSLDHNSSAKSSSAAASATTAAAGGGLDLHEVSDPLVLEREVRAAVRNGTVESTTVPAASGTSSASPCRSAVRVPAGVTPIVLGTATFHGRPAVVFVARQQSRTLVFVLATGSCRLLESQFLK